MTGEAVALKLSLALAQALPEPFQLSASGNRLDLIFRGRHLQGSIFDDSPAALCQRIPEIISAVSAIQDAICLQFRRPWPQFGTDGEMSHLPSPDARCVDGDVEIWFGARSSPVLLLGVPMTEPDSGF